METLKKEKCSHSLHCGSLLSKAFLWALRNSKKLDKRSYVPGGGIHYIVCIPLFLNLHDLSICG